MGGDGGGYLYWLILISKSTLARHSFKVKQGREEEGKDEEAVAQ